MRRNTEYSPKGEKMEFLKEILGNDLYDQVKNAVSSYNEKADKDNKVSIVNINSGEYVSKNKYSALETDLNNTKISLDNANKTIADLKKNSTDNEDLQNKIKAYESEKKNLETSHKQSLEKLIKESAIREALYAEKAKHPDLLLSKFDLSKILLDEKGEKVVVGIEEQMKANRESYKDLFEETGDTKPNSAYHYSPASGNKGDNGGSADFVSIIKDNQSRKL